MNKFEIGDDVRVVKEVSVYPEAENLTDFGISLGDIGEVIYVTNDDDYNIAVAIKDGVTLFCSEELELAVIAG